MSGVLLVVDDDEWSCWQFDQLMLDSGFQIVFACNGASAFDLFLKYRPLNILIDINIDCHDGLWLTNAILGLDHKSVIYLTADQPLAKIYARRSKLAVAAILDKPIDFDMLKIMLKPEKRADTPW